MKHYDAVRLWLYRDFKPRLLGMGPVHVLIATTIVALATFLIPTFISVPLWLLFVFRYFSLKYGVTSLWNPAILVFWIGILPSTAALLFYKSFPFAFEYEPYLISPIWLLNLTALVWGIQLASGSQRITASRATLSTGGVTSRRKLEFLAVVLLLVALACYVFLYIANGSAYSSSNPEAARTEIVAGSGLIGTLGFATLTVGLVLYVSDRHARKVHLLAVPIACLSLVLLALTGTRAILLRMFIVIVVVACIRVFGRISAALLVGGAFIGTIVVGALGAYRFRGSEMGIFDSVLGRLSAEPHVSGMIVEYARYEGFWYGRAALSAFGIYLPGQAPLLGDVLKTELGAEFSGGGLSTPLPAEGFLEFGWAGTILYGLVAGLLIGLVCRLLSGNRLKASSYLVLCLPLGITLSGIVGGLGTTLAVYFLPQLATCMAVIAMDYAVPKRCLEAWSRISD